MQNLAHYNPEKFLNTEQKVECPSQIFTWYTLTLKQLPFPMTQISAFCLKNQSHPALKLDLPPSSISRRTPKTQRSSMNLGSLPSMYGTNLLLDQLLRICTCHSDLVLTQKHRKQGSPLTDTVSACQTE